MPKRALIEKRPWLLASLAAAIAWYVLRDENVPGVALIVLKGAAAALLAAYALLRHPSTDARILALALAFGAAGDMAIELWEPDGGALFIGEHLLLIWLFLRHPREAPTPSQRAASLALLIGTPLISYLLSDMWPVGFYGLALGAMAASAWFSSFPRYRVGMGAVLFVVSDWLIFSDLGSPEPSALRHVLVWPLYYAAQFLIATGVIQTLYRRESD